MAYWNGLGNELGQGLSDFAKQLIGTQNTLQQQSEQKAQQDRQFALQQQQATLQAQQAEEQRRQFDEQQARLLARDQMDAETLKYNQGRLERQDGITGRESDLKTALAPMMDSFMKGLDTDLQRYAPTITDKTGLSRPNPQYSPALYQAAVDRRKKATKLWSNVTLGVGSGENWDAARSEFMQFVGGDAGPTGAAAPVAAPVPAAPTPAPTPMPPMPRGEALGTQEPAAPTAPTLALPPRVQDIPASQLLEMPDDQLLAQYGQGGMEYATAARGEYAAQVQARRAADTKIRVDSWDIQLKELAKRTDLTADQRLAMTTITGLMSRDSLSDEEAARMAAAFNLLTPKMYTPESWQKVLDSKDPDVILAQLPVYQKFAPDLVAGFDPSGLITTRDDKHNAAAADVALKGAQTKDTLSTTTRRDTLLPGEVAQQGAELTNTEGDTALKDAQRNAAEVSAGRMTALLPGELTQQGADLKSTQTGTAATQQTTKTAAYDMAVKQLASYAATGATAYQLQQTPMWYQLKRDLGVNDAALTSLLQEGRYQYSLGVKGKELELKVKESDLLTAGVERGATLATTSMTLEQIKTEIGLRQPKIDQLNAQIANTQAGTENYRSLVAERDRLVGEREQLITAQTAAAQGQAAASGAQAVQTTALTPIKVAQGWANVAEIQAGIKNDRERTAAYVQSVKGNPTLDQARIDEIRSRTALNRAKDPNDPLYNPAIASSKPGDPIDVLKKQAGVFYTQSDQALKAASTLQTQINALQKRGEGITGTFDMTRLTPDDQKKLAGLIAQRDGLFTQAQGYRQKGDDVITNGMQKLPANVTKTDPYGTTDLGGVRAVTVFPGTAPIPKTFDGAARAAVSATAGRLGIDANALAAVISFETSGSFNPAIKNPKSSGSGLIQFMDATAKEMGTTTAALRAMPFATQMQYVERYLQGRGIGPGSDIGDIYAAVTGSGYKRGSAEYENNKVWDADGNGVIEKGEQVLSPKFQAHVRDYFGGQGQAGPQMSTTPAATSTSTPTPSQLEATLKAAIQSGDRATINSTADALIAAGYTEAQVKALLGGKS